MKKILLVVFATSLLACAANKAKINLNNNGFIAEGYDVTEYFNNRALEGNDHFVATYDGARYKFTSQINKNTFEANPVKYVPQYGGFCAYAIGAENKKIGINPKSYEIRDGKLYLFYDTAFADTKKKWNEEGAEILQQKADRNWVLLRDN